MEAVTDAPFTLLVLPGELAERPVRPESGQLAAYSLLCRGLRACFRCPLKGEKLLGCASLAAEIHAALRVSCGRYVVEGGEKK